MAAEDGAAGITGWAQAGEVARGQSGPQPPQPLRGTTGVTPGSHRGHTGVAAAQAENLGAALGE